MKKPVESRAKLLIQRALSWLRGEDLNLRPSGYEPDELPGCSTPRKNPRRGKVPRQLVCSNRGRGCEDRFARNCHNVVSISPTACMVYKTEPSPDIATRALASLLRDIVASGRKPIETPDIADAIAVHDLRKAFKRWRAILRLIAPMVGDEAESLRLEARDLAREMAAARDGQAAQEALADLGDSFPKS